MTLKNTATKGIVLAIATSFAATAVMPVTAAEAGGKKHWKKHHQVHKHHNKKHYSKHRNNHNGDALAAGVLGFALGAIIVDQVTRPRTIYVQPDPVYIAPQPVYREPYVHRRPLNDVYTTPQYDDGYGSYDDDGPRVIRYDDGISASYEPWSPEWARWCDNRFRSFNVNTGTYRGYDGKDHFCVVK